MDFHFNAGSVPLLVSMPHVGTDIPDDVARQLSQVLWCCLFTRHDLEQASKGLPFERVADESAAEYERAHLPEGQYPSTGWYEGWCGGQDLFDLPAERPPMELRWLVYRRVEESPPK